MAIKKARLFGRFSKDLRELIASESEGIILHICSGSWHFGITVDMVQPADIKADAWLLPFRDSVADTVICDPPYTDAFGKKYGARIQGVLPLLDELVRVLKPNGKLIFLHWLIPPKRYGKLETVYLVTYGGCRPVRALTILRKSAAL